MRIWYLYREAQFVRYNECSAFVIVAETEEQARNMAAGEAGDELAEIWRSPFITVERVGRPLLSKQVERIILRSFVAG